MTPTLNSNEPNEFLLLQLKKMCKEGAYWGKLCIPGCWIRDTSEELEHSHKHLILLLEPFAGTVSGLYVGLEYGVERVRGTRDWVISKTTGRSCFLHVLIFEYKQDKLC